MQFATDWTKHDLDEIRYYRMRYLERQQFFFNTMTKMLILATVFGVIFLFVSPMRGILGRYEEILSAEVEGMKRLPNLQKQIETLQKQLTALTSESIENRLKTIETAIRAGNIKPEEVASLQLLKEDLGILKTYMFRDPGELVELKQLQKNYQEIRENQEKYILKDDVMREVSFLHNLFYASIGMFGLLFAVMGGSWWFSNRKLKQFTQEIQESQQKEKSQATSDNKNP